MKTVAKVLLQDKNGDVLLLRRSDSHPHFPLHIDFPGGEVEPNESHALAVQREIKEETGIYIPLSKLEVAYVKRLSDRLTHIVYIANVPDEKPSIKLSWEHTDYTWTPLKQFISAVLPKNVDSYHLTVLDYINRK